MTRPLQPGDLCLIINADKDKPYLIGTTCILDKHYPAGSKLPFGIWRKCDDCWGVSYSSGKIGLCLTAYLMRIDGHQDTETTEQKEELTV